jgi:hypothetical protein
MMGHYAAPWFAVPPPPHLNGQFLVFFSWCIPVAHCLLDCYLCTQWGVCQCILTATYIIHCMVQWIPLLHYMYWFTIPTDSTTIV